MKTINCTVLLIFSLFIASCGVASHYGRSFKIPKRAFALDGANKNDASFHIPTRYNYTNPQSPDYFRTVYADARGLDRQAVRNQVAKEMVALIDENHAFYHDSLRRSLTATSILGETFKIGFDTAAVIAKGARAKTVLAALAGASTATAATIDSKTLQKQTIGSILKAIKIRKDTEYLRMAANFDKSISAYDLGDVMVDLGKYWESGLLGSGIAELSKITTKKVEQVEKAVDQQKGQGKTPAKAAQGSIKTLSSKE